MSSSSSRTPTASPLGLRLSDILAGRTQGWWQHDLVALKALFYAQRRLELFQRRPDAPLRGLSGLMRDNLARGARLFKGEGADWFDTLAADIALDPGFSDRLEARLKAWLAERPAQTDGRGVAMILPTLAAGGAEGQMARLATGLIKEGVPVTVLVKHVDEERFDFHRAALEAAGVHVRTIGGYFDEASVSDLTALDIDLHRTSRALIRALGEIRPAAVHAWMDEMGAAGGLAAAAAGVPAIVIDGRNLGPLWFETRGLGSIRAAFRALEGRALFANNSEAGAADYRDWLGRPDLPIRVVRNGLDRSDLVPDKAGSAARRAQLAPDGGPLIGGMMRFAPEKRPMLWLEAAAAFARRNDRARFVLWGDGAMRAAMERRAAALGLKSKLTLPGVTRERPAALGSIDVLLLASIAEGTPNVALEAQALGTPVAASGAGGVREAIAPALRDLVVDQPDADLLAAAIDRALTFSRQATRNAADVWISETFSPETQRRDYKTLYGLRNT